MNLSSSSWRGWLHVGSLTNVTGDFWTSLEINKDMSHSSWKPDTVMINFSSIFYCLFSPRVLRLLLCPPLLLLLLWESRFASGCCFGVVAAHLHKVELLSTSNRRSGCWYCATCCRWGARRPSSPAFIENERLPAAYDAHEAFGLNWQLHTISLIWSYRNCKVCHILQAIN